MLHVAQCASGINIAHFVMPCKQAQRWCWTMSLEKANQERGFSLTGEEWITHLQLEFELIQDDLNYAVVGFEIGKAGGQQDGVPVNPNEHIGLGYSHLQGFCNFSKRKSMRQVKAIIDFNAMHLEQAKGTDAQNQAYCSKDGVYFEIGEPQFQRARNDLKDLTDLIKAGGTVQDCWALHPTTMVRCHKGIEEYHRVTKNRKEVPKYRLDEFNMFWPREMDWTCSIILWGASGIGKTSYARALLPNALLVSHLDDLALYEGGDYDGIIFDDMSFNHIPREGQIHLVDIDEYRSIHIRYRTAGVPANTKKIFTTNIHGGNCFLLNDSAIARRTKVILLN